MDEINDTVKSWGYSAMLALLSLLMSDASLGVQYPSNWLVFFSATYIPVFLTLVAGILIFASFLGLSIPIFQAMCLLGLKAGLKDDVSEIFNEEWQRIKQKPLHEYVIDSILKAAYASIWIAIAIAGGVWIGTLTPIASPSMFVASMLGISIAFMLGIAVTDSLIAVSSPLFRGKQKRKEKMSKSTMLKDNQQSSINTLSDKSDDSNNSEWVLPFEEVVKGGGAW